MRDNIHRAIFLSIQKKRGADIERHLKNLEESQWWDRQRLRQLQWSKLIALIEYAYKNVPYYRETWKNADIHPEDIRTWNDFESLPMLTRTLIQENSQKLISRERDSVPLHSGMTSGSTSIPFHFIRSQDAKARYWAARYRGYRWHGLDIVDRQARLSGVPFDLWPRIQLRVKDYCINRCRLPIYDLSEVKMKRYAQKLNVFRPKYLNGLASALNVFGTFIREEKIRKHYPWIPLKAVVSEAEILTPSNRTLLEETFECPVINYYATSETGLIAIECPEGFLHTVPENIYLETIPVIDTLDSGDGNVPEEVVITELNSHVMPFIRYRVGDLIECLPENKYCSCGRTSALVKNIVGRTNNLIVTPEGKILVGTIFDFVTKYSLRKGGGIKQFIVRQDEVDRLIFFIVKDAGFSEKTLRLLEDKTHEIVSPRMKIECRFVNAIPRTQAGKLMNFSSTLNVNEVLAQLCSSEKLDNETQIQNN